MTPSVWVERYRPKTLGDVVFQDASQQERFQSFIADGDIPNLLLYGVQGTGKSSISKCLIRDLKVDPLDVLTVKGTKDKVEEIRTKVNNFAWTMPVGKFKVVRLEEFDFLSQEGQSFLRTLTEDVSSSTRWIGTCNYINRIMPPLRDRFQEYFFRAPDKEQIAARMITILEKEKIDFEADDLIAYIDAGYPSIRQIVQLLQKNSINGKLRSPTSAEAVASDWKLNLLDLLVKNNWKGARKVVCESATREEHEDVFRFLYDNLGKFKIDEDAAIITIADYADRHSRVSDTELNLAALFVALGKL